MHWPKRKYCSALNQLGWDEPPQLQRDDRRRDEPLSRSATGREIAVAGQKCGLCSITMAHPRLNGCMAQEARLAGALSSPPPPLLSYRKGRDKSSRRSTVDAAMWRDGGLNAAMPPLGLGASCDFVSLRSLT